MSCTGNCKRGRACDCVDEAEDLSRAEKAVLVLLCASGTLIITAGLGFVVGLMAGWVAR